MSQTSSPALYESLNEVVQQGITEISQASSLVLMVWMTWQLVLSLAISTLEQALRLRAQAPTEWPACPQCGQRLRSKGFRSRQMLTLLGPIHWQRRVGRCPKRCEIGQIAPLDAQLGIGAFEKTSLEVKRLACLLAVFVPFHTTSILLGTWFGLNLSPMSLWEWVQEFGKKAQQQLEQQLERFEQGFLPASEADPLLQSFPLLIGGDGVMVPFRPHAGGSSGKTVWREVKIGVFARFCQSLQSDGQSRLRLVHRRVVAVLGTPDMLAQRLRLEGAYQRWWNAPKVIWISDGAKGLWNLYRHSLSLYALGILDFYHAAQHLWQFAHAGWGGNTEDARRWFESARHRLRHEAPQPLIDELQQITKQPGFSETNQQTLDTALAYFQTHLAHLEYARWAQEGLPLGSGFVESACKWLIQQRFKGVGMRWSELGFNHLLHLRLLWVNGRFDPLFYPSPN